MSLQETFFIPFKNSVAAYTLPERFTFPFYYDPHPLCLLAAKELQEHLKRQKEWQHNFGINGDKDTAIGKMFGVLLVKNKQNEIGYLAAFSGKLADKNHLPQFVPPVFDMLTDSGFFKVQQVKINQLNDKIESLQNNPKISEFKKALKSETDLADLQIEAHRKIMRAGRKSRKEQRAAAQTEMTSDVFVQLKEQLSKQSIAEKNTLKTLKTYWHERVHKAENNLNKLNSELFTLKNQRKDLSASLQKKLFEQYCFLNKAGVTKSLYAIFKETPQHTPPAGAGECAAPKLLHYAFQWQMKPLAMAEFWWGASPKSAIRKHQNFYAACLGKCQPILKHMLEGVKMDENPLLLNPAEGKTIDIVYEDDIMLVINKPADFLSVPGKSIDDSVYLRMKQRYPEATGPLIVHRLDMSTSGLMLIALTKEAHKNLQKQFIKRSVKKRYVALLDGLIKAEKGIIELPLRVDLDDRPRQLVCYEHGKNAKTQWQVIERKNNKSKVYFYPVTGRTHQLRVHSAHINGLNTPILGDDLYGNKADRLYLQADYLEFNHPRSKALMRFQIEAEF